jgi:hypothetical protein
LKTKFFFTIVIILIVVFSVFKMIGKNSLIVYNLNLNVHCNSTSSNIIKSIFKDLGCYSNFNIDNNSPELNFLINPKNLMLTKLLMENVIDGDYRDYNHLNKSFKSKIIHKNQVYKAEIKFHGKNPSSQHIKGQFFSMDVKILDGKEINGFTSFDLILKDRMNPRSLFFPFISSNRVIYQNSNLFKVSINSAEWEYFYMQPNRDEKFLYSYGLNIFLPNLKEDPYESNRGFVFEKNYKPLNSNSKIFKNITNISQKTSIANKYNELNNYISSEKEIQNISRFFDIEYLSNFLAIYLLLGCDSHGNTDGNMLVGFNLDNGKFYPILHRDYNSRYLSDENYNDCLMDKQYLNKLLKNPYLKKEIINSLNLIDNDLSLIKSKYKEELTKYYLSTFIGSYIHYFHKEIFLNDLEVFSKNILFLRETFLINQVNQRKKSNKMFFNEGKFKKSISHSQINFEVDSKNNQIILFGENIIRKNIEFPIGFKILIKDSTSINFEEKAYLKFHNDLIISGGKNNSVKILGNNKGTLIISDLFNSNSNLIIDNAYIEKLTESVHDGTRYMGGITVLSKANVNIQNSTFVEFSSEDVINLKGFNKLSAYFNNNKFIKILNDGIDLDFVKEGIISNNIISASNETVNKNSDGLDFSKTSFEVNNNVINNFLDKCISVGEESKGSFDANQIKNCSIGIANKDGSVINLSNNYFENNTANISSYIKKKSYQKPIENYAQ